MNAVTIRTALLLICFSLLTSCDYVYWYDYKVANTTDAPVDVRFQARYMTADTVVTIAAGAVKVIYHDTHGVQADPTGPFFTEISGYMYTFSVTANGKASRRNFLDNGCWTFSKHKKTGIYTTTITAGEF